MFDIRTDLAMEAHELASKNKSNAVDGVIFKEETVAGYKMTNIEILNSEGEKATGKPIGKYLTLDVGHLWDNGYDCIEEVCTVVSDMISSLAPNYDSILAVGLGNSDITADALGPFAVSNIIASRHLKEYAPHIYTSMGFSDISTIVPGVLAQTGIEASETVNSIAEMLCPSAVVVIDALASGEVSRLGTVIQISNTGIAPGSGVGNFRKAITEEQLRVPVISIGIPTVVDALSLARCISGNHIYNEDLSKYENMFVTPKDCDKIISFMSRVIGYSVNMAFHKNLSFEDMRSVLS